MPDKVQYIKLPDGSWGKFDENASDEEIRGHIQKDFPDAFKPPPPPGAVSRFLKSASDASGLSAVGHAIMHPGETLGNVAKTVADPYGPDSLISKAVVPAVQNTVENAQQGIDDYKKEGFSQKTRRDFGRAVPIVGPALAKGQGQYDTGDYAGAAGTIGGTVAGLAAPEAIKEAMPGVVTAAKTAGRVPGAIKQGASRFSQSAYPKNLALTPQEAAAQEFVKAIKPDVAGVERVKGSTSEVPGILDYAKRNNIPINGKLDFAKAAEGAAKEVQGHYDNNLLKPHSGKFQTVPPDYNGEMSGNRQNQATLGQINDRVNAINSELKSNFRKKLNSQTTEAQASDAELNAEKSKLTDILHSKLADMNGLQPEDIAGVRQSAGKMRTLAEETKLSGNNDTLSAGRHETGSAFSPVKNAVDAVTDKVAGGPEIVGNRVFKGALEGFEPNPTNLPQPVLPDPATVPTTPEAAQQEFLRQQQLEQGAQDAAASRGALAGEAREGNAAASFQARTGRPSPVAQDSISRFLQQPSPTAGQATPPITLQPPTPPPAAELPTIQDKEVVPADPSRGIKPITLPVEVPSASEITPAATPDTHAFSKQAWSQQNPSGDVNAAADAAKAAGYDVQD